MTYAGLRYYHLLRVKSAIPPDTIWKQDPVRDRKQYGLEPQ